MTSVVTATEEGKSSSDLIQDICTTGWLIYLPECANSK